MSHERGRNTWLLERQASRQAGKQAGPDLPCPAVLCYALPCPALPCKCRCRSRSRGRGRNHGRGRGRGRDRSRSFLFLLFVVVFIWKIWPTKIYAKNKVTRPWRGVHEKTTGFFNKCIISFWEKYWFSTPKTWNLSNRMFKIPKENDDYFSKKLIPKYNTPTCDISESFCLKNRHRFPSGF